MQSTNSRDVRFPRPGIPLSMAHGPDEYVPGEQEPGVLLTSLRDLLQWAQNYPRSRSIWPFT